MTGNFGHIRTPLKRIHLELTNVCDFNCVFCPKSEMNREFGYMKTDLAKRLINEISHNKIADKITLHVMGEPTLHSDFFEILRHADEVNMPIGLTTNGAGLGKDIGAKLLNYDLHQIDISFQTPDEKSYELRKSRNLTFEEYSNGLLNFFSEYHRKHPDTIFKFRFLNTTFKLKDIETKAGTVDVTSGNKALRKLFRDWTERVYDLYDVNVENKQAANNKINNLKAYKWNVVEIIPNTFFETYILRDWGHGFTDDKIIDAWGGYCFGMRDHFAVLYNGAVSLCCLDFNGRTAFGNVTNSSLEEVLSSEKLRHIMFNFKKFRPTLPYCKRCLGSKNVISWIFKPIFSIFVLKFLKSFFYNQTRLFKSKDWRQV